MKNCLPFYRQYKQDYNCDKPGKTRHGALASILICLEKAIEDGKAYVTMNGKMSTTALSLNRKISLISINCSKNYGVYQN